MHKKLAHLTTLFVRFLYKSFLHRIELSSIPHKFVQELASTCITIWLKITCVCFSIW